MTPLATSPGSAHGRHPFTTAVAGRAGRPGSNPATVPDVPHSPPKPGLTYAALLAVEARLASALRGGEPEDDPADAATVAALGLAAGRTTGHALGVVRGDIETVEDVVRGFHLPRSRPEPGDWLYTPGAGR